SLHVKGDMNPAFLTLPLPANINKLYVRGYFYMTRKLGQNPGANHETLFGIRKDKDTEIRFGEIKGVLGVNEVPSDNITPKMDQWGKGPLIAANKWVCIEGAFIGDKAQHEVHGWADGTEVISVTSGDQWNNVEPATFLNGYWKEFMIGWQSFSNAANEVWIDDLVLSPTRVNCLWTELELRFGHVGQGVARADGSRQRLHQRRIQDRIVRAVDQPEGFTARVLPAVVPVKRRNAHVVRGLGHVFHVIAAIAFVTRLVDGAVFPQNHRQIFIHEGGLELRHLRLDPVFLSPIVDARVAGAPGVRFCRARERIRIVIVIAQDELSG